MKKTALLFLSVAMPLLLKGEEAAVRRIHSHLIIGDPRSACEEGKNALKSDAGISLHEAYLTSLCKNHEHQEMLKEWEVYSKLLEDPYEKRELIEGMAWSIIEKESKSSSPMIRFISMLGAYFGQDAKSVPILEAALADPNLLIRSIALQAAATMRDAPVKRKVLQVFREERNDKVRIEAIRTVGKMKLIAAKPELLAVIADDTVMAEVKAAAIEALVTMEETIGREEMVVLAKSSRAGLRQLACRVAAAFELERDIDLIIPLLKDIHSSVRTSALYALGILKVKAFDQEAIEEYVRPLINDRDPTTAIYAAWVLTLYDDPSGHTAFKRWINDPHQEKRILAAGALSSTGSHAFPVIKEIFYTTDDPYVRLNIALSLITQRREVVSACTVLRLGLRDLNERWMWKEGDFHLLAPSDLTHQPGTPNLPEAMDQVVRLKVLNALAILQDPYAIDAIKQFLKDKKWGVAGEASTLLLTEGDEASAALVETLLEEPDSKMRIQAALVLALWGRGENAIQALEDAYDKSPRDLKERILEGLGRIGAKKSIPFLIERLKEQSPSLRIIAASALLQTLNS